MFLLVSNPYPISNWRNPGIKYPIKWSKKVQYFKGFCVLINEELIYSTFAEVVGKEVMQNQWILNKNAF